jgi:hypothetical protein
MLRLGGWERLLIVLSLGWFVIAIVGYFSVLADTTTAYTFISEIVPSRALHWIFNWIPDTSGLPNNNPFGDLRVIPVFSFIGFGTFLLGPPLLACVFFWSICWVIAGFRQQP